MFCPEIEKMIRERIEQIKNNIERYPGVYWLAATLVLVFFLKYKFNITVADFKDAAHKISLMLTASVMFPYIIMKLWELGSNNNNDPVSPSTNNRPHFEVDRLIVEIFFSPALLGVAFFLLSYEIIELYNHIRNTIEPYTPAHIYK